MWLATGGLELGAVSVMLYGFREREVILDIFEAVTGLRMNHAYIRIGGVMMDLPEEGEQKIRALLDEMPGADRRVRDAARTRTRSGVERNAGRGRAVGRATRSRSA